MTPYEELKNISNELCELATEWRKTHIPTPQNSKVLGKEVRKMLKTHGLTVNEYETLLSIYNKKTINGWFAPLQG